MLDASSRKERSHRGAPPLTCEKYTCTSNRSKAKLNSGRPTTISQDLESPKDLMFILFHAKASTVRSSDHNDHKDGLPCVTNDFERYFTLRKAESIVLFYLFHCCILAIHNCPFSHRYMDTFTSRQSDRDLIAAFGSRTFQVS